MIHLIKRKNPSEKFAKKAKEILKNVDDYEYLTEGAAGEIFYFMISTNIIIDNTILKSGEYILKINKYKLECYEIEYLKIYRI